MGRPLCSQCTFSFSVKRSQSFGPTPRSSCACEGCARAIGQALMESYAFLYLFGVSAIRLIDPTTYVKTALEFCSLAVSNHSLTHPKSRGFAHSSGMAVHGDSVRRAVGQSQQYRVSWSFPQQFPPAGTESRGPAFPGPRDGRVDHVMFLPTS